jgi:hypothetical protein
MRNGAVRAKIQVSFRGREWGTVEVDIARREGEAEVDLLPAIPLLDQFGLAGPEELECISLRHHVAQKFHAVTRPMPGGGANDRFRDLVDLLLMRQLVHDYGALREACEEVFARRGTHGWPPALQVPASWTEPFARMAEETACRSAKSGRPSRRWSGSSPTSLPPALRPPTVSTPHPGTQPDPDAAETKAGRRTTRQKEPDLSTFCHSQHGCGGREPGRRRLAGA